MISLKFIPLSFITSNEEIIRQIKNTVVFSHLFESCKETTFNHYIETTQYGFTASALESGSHRMLRITDIHHSKVNWESVPFCDCPDDEKYLLKDNDILVARTGGTTGKSFFVEDPPSNAVFASYLIRIRLKEGVNIDLINAFLNSYCFWSQIVEMKAGSAQPNVNAEKLKTLVMPDCDSETQAKTVRLIKEQDSSDSIQERINEVETLFWNNNEISTELDHQLALVKELRQAYLREAMQGKLVPQDPTDEPAEILLEKIKAEKEKLVAEKRIKRDKPLPPINPEEFPFEIPSNWIWCRYADVALIKSNLVSPFDYPNHPHVAPDNIEKNTGRLLPYKTVLEDEVKSANHYFYPKQLIYSKVRPKLNKVVLVEFEGLCSADMYPIQPLIDSRFLQAGMLSEYFLAEVDRFDNRVKMPKINQNQLSQIPVPVPPLAEQERIVAKLERLMRFCDELEANIKQGIVSADRLLQTALKEALEPK